MNIKVLNFLFFFHIEKVNRVSVTHRHCTSLHLGCRMHLLVQVVSCEASKVCLSHRLGTQDSTFSYSKMWIPFGQYSPMISIKRRHATYKGYKEPIKWKKIELIFWYLRNRATCIIIP